MLYDRPLTLRALAEQLVCVPGAGRTAVARQPGPGPQRTDIRERKEVYIKHTKGCTEQAEGGSSKPEGARGTNRGRRGSAAPYRDEQEQPGPDLGQDVPGRGDSKGPRPAAGRTARASPAVGMSVDLF